MAGRKLSWQERRFAVHMAWGLITEAAAILLAALTGKVSRRRHGWKESKEVATGETL